MDEENEEDGGGKGGSVPFVCNHFEPWIKRDRDMAPKTRCTIYLMRAEECRSVDGMDMICIRIRGQAFLLHQIRLLISSAILVVRGVVPISAIDAAFLLPFHINFPLAPAEGLILVDAGFSRNANGKTVSVANTDADYTIMEADEFQRSEEFKQSHIYTKVKTDFAADGGQLCTSFLRFVDERFRVPPETENEWQSLTTVYRERQLAENALRDQRESARIIREVVFFRNELLQKDEAFSSFFFLADSDTGGASKKRRASQAIPHKKLLPNALATDLVIFYGVQPSSVVVNNALRALATRMVTASDGDDLSPSMSNREIIAFMETKGTLGHWANLPKHAWIE